MAKKPPVYKDEDNVYEADTCTNLAQAAKEGNLSLQALVHGTYPGKPLPKNILPEVKTIGYWDAGRDQDWGLTVHRNEGLELTYLATGKLEFSVDNKIYTLKPGDLTITRPWQPHKVGNPNVEADRLYWMILDLGVRHPHQTWKWPDWLILDPKDLNELTLLLRQNEQHVWTGVSELEKCCKQIGKLVISSELQISRLVLVINELLILLLEMLRKQKMSLKPALTSGLRSTELFLKELELSLAKPWTIDSMAESVGLKRTRFAYYCKKLENMTPVQYLNFVRIRKSKQLMKENPGKDITSIAMDCGFTTSQYFATVFKQLEGMSPTLFRKTTSSK